MRIFNLSAILILMTSSTVVFGQKQVDLTLKSTSQTKEMSCLDVLLRSAHGSDIDLAGQNYRLFYNSDKLSFLKEKITHSLDSETYSKIDLINTEDNNIGFVSISIDGRALTNSVVKLAGSGAWEKTINICFGRSTDEPFDITWANSKKTFLFATAEVAMSEWVNEERQQILTPNEIHDFTSLNEIAHSEENIRLKIYPNPVSDYINVDLESQLDEGRVIIKDVIGREVVNQKVNNLKSSNYSLMNWPEGTYTFLLLSQDGRQLASEKIMKITP